MIRNGMFLKRFCSREAQSQYWCCKYLGGRPGSLLCDSQFENAQFDG